MENTEVNKETQDKALNKTDVSGCLNQNWIKINKKRDNLPSENCKCWIWTKDGLMFGEYNSTAKDFYGWQEIKFSHYMIIPEPMAPNK